MDQFKLEWQPQTRENLKTLKITGPFLLTEVFDFQNALRDNPAPVTLIDVSDVPYMDSAALGSILGFHVTCQRESRKYGLCGVTDRVKTLFRVAGVEGLLNVYSTAAEGEAALTA